MSQGQSWAETGTFQGTLQALKIPKGALQAAAPAPRSARCPPGPRRGLLSLLQVNVLLGDGRSLGLTIRGGAEYGLGIYVTGVDPGSEAESSGLKVRDP